MIYKQNLKNHFLVTGFTWVIMLIFFLGWWYNGFEHDYILVVGLFYLFFTLPAVYLHIEYSIRNFGDEIEIENDRIKGRKNGIYWEFDKSELSKIIIYKSASLDNWGIPFSQMEYYRFARIITKPGDEIIITCLLCLNVDEEVQKLVNIPIQRKKSFFCTTWWK